ncbi:MAG: FAD-dependent oxidoreductase [Verrucomicrobiota bacterium]
MNAEDVRGFWEMDDGQGAVVADSSGNENDGKLRDANWAQGVRSAALQISSGGSIEVSHAESLNITNAISMQVWIKPWNPRFQDKPNLLSKPDAYALHFGPGKSVSLSLKIDGKNTVLSSKYTDWKNGKWQHVAGTYDGKHMKLYVNGQLDNEKAVSGKISTNSSPLYMGSIKRRNSYQGTMDQMKLSASAFSEEEIYATFDAGSVDIARTESRFTSYFHKGTHKRDPKAVVPGFVWIEAEDFQNYGGWWMDTQFVPRMGSPYLLAAGIGYPVQDATTSITLEETGSYTLWVRNRNWIQNHAPGQFRISVAGKPSETVFGTADSNDWVWQSGGTFELEAGKIDLVIRDLTGYYGRVDALLLVQDSKYTPPTELNEYKKERDRLTGKDTEIEFIGDYDVVVVGGGVAGVNAAIASARNGAKTALIQDRPMVGGNNSAEMGVPVLGPADYGKKNSRESGLNEEIGRYQSYHFLSKWATGAEHIASQEENLTVYLNRHVYDVEMDKNRITAVRAFDMITTKATRYTGRVFIDCTGDGWLGYYAGSEYMLGRDAKETFGDSHAPDKADKLTMSGSLFQGSILAYKNKDTGKPYDMDSPEWLWDLRPNGDSLEERKGFDKSMNSGTWWHENRNNVDDLWDPEGARDGLIRVSLSYVNWIKQHSSLKEKAENFKIEALPVTNARRETRRLVGDYVLKEADVREAVLFEDRIGSGGWGLDIHHIDGIFSNEGPFDFNTHVPTYSVPYRMLYSKDIDNMLFAGRHVSVSRVALGTVRVQGTTGIMGQAAGTAGALCIKHNTNPRGIYQKHIIELQQELLKDDQYIIDLKNEDPNDLALKAKVTASSSAKQLGFGKKQVIPTGDFHDLNTERSVMFAAGELDRVGNIFALIKSTNSEPTELHLEVKALAEYGNYTWADPMAKTSVTVPANGEHWVEFELDAEMNTSRFVGLFLKPTPGLSWALMETGPSGSSRGYLEKAPDTWKAINTQFYAFYMDTTIKGEPKFEPENVNNGITRIVDDQMNMWKSDPTAAMPQWVELNLGKKQSFNTVYLTFDTNLNQAKHQTWEWKVTDRIVPESVKDYSIQYYNGSDWVTVQEVEDNYQRRRIHNFPKVSSDRLRVLVNRTNGDASARIYEVRVYNES